MASATTINKGFVESDVKLDGKTAVITGCNTGIGFETALELCKRRCRVLMACRDRDKAEKAKAKIMEEVKEADIVVKQLDLASLESVRACAKDINETESRLDILINNAGVMMCPDSKTKDGFEMQLGVNHIGHFLFTNLLLELMKKSAPSRIVIVSSLGYKYGKANWEELVKGEQYNPVSSYCSSKLANILFCKELAHRLEGTGVTTYSLYPGYTQTELRRHVNRDSSHINWKWKIGFAIFTLVKSPVSAKHGSQTTLYCAIAPELEKESGKFYFECKEKQLLTSATCMEDARKLLELSEEWTKEPSTPQQQNQ